MATGRILLPEGAELRKPPVSRVLGLEMRDGKLGLSSRGLEPHRIISL